MSKSKRTPASTKPASENQPDALFGRVVSILEQARGNVVRAVNTQMVLAYWLIGREIVQELQGGKARANYGERVVEDLSARLTERFGKGFSTRNVKLFKQFYLTWHKTSPIGHPLVAQSSVPEIGQPPVAQSSPLEKLQPPSLERPPAISPQLTWSHYIALMRVNELERATSTSARRWPADGTNARWSGRFTRNTITAACIVRSPVNSSPMVVGCRKPNQTTANC